MVQNNRNKLIEELVKIYDTRPKNCSSYHIVDMIIYAAERRGMLPPSKGVGEKDEWGYLDYVNEWEENCDENLWGV